MPGADAPPLPGTPLHDAASMRATDRAAIEQHGVPGLTLMEAAGARAAAVARDRYPAVRRVVCLCGGGNNGGDGLIVARLLAADGLEVRVHVLAGRPYSGDAAAAEAAARAAEVPFTDDLGAALGSADLVVDALLGTGATGAPRAGVARAIAAVVASGLPVLALDVPSGVDASTGEVAGDAIRADATVAFHAPKVGLAVAPGVFHAGDVIVVPIGIPPEAEQPAPAVLTGAAAIDALPARPRGGSKYDAGRVVTIGGSRGMTGAIALASRAALRAGAGIVTACVPASLEPILEVKLTEPMTRGCIDREGALLPEAAEEIRAMTERGGAVVLGPGIGRDPATARLVRDLLDLDAPLVLDADGLHALGQDLEALAGRSAPTVITPHAGEAGRLLGWPSAEVGERRLAAVRALSTRSGAVALLKGADTLVAAPDGRLAVRDGDDAGLATAGTGDVLAGTIGALLARGAEPALAAAAGAAAHLAAARAAAAERPRRAIIAGDLIDHLALGAS